MTSRSVLGREVSESGSILLGSKRESSFKALERHFLNLPGAGTGFAISACLMDVQRKANKPLKFLKRVAVAAVLVALVGVAAMGFVNRESPAPKVSRATIWTGVVERGAFDREVRGQGILEPERARWITTPREGVIESLLVEPGTSVQPDTVLMVLSNPNLEREVFDARWRLKSAEAEYTARKASLENETLALKSSLARLGAQLDEARLRGEVDKKLYEDELISERDYQLSQSRVDQLEELIAIETQRVDKQAESHPAVLAVNEARIEQGRALLALFERELAALQVRAGVEGVLLRIEEHVEIGRRVGAGTVLAMVCDPRRLKAQIQVPEALARNVQVGQTTRIDTRSSVASGQVSHVAPGAQDGSVEVDIRFNDPLPEGARPDQAVSATIVIEHLDDAVFVKRPVNSRPESTMGLFVVDATGQTANRQPVQLGKSSVQSIQVLNGLAVGDTVILSDMSLYDDDDQVRLD